MNGISTGDSIVNLPTDEIVPNHKEIEIIDKLFNSNDQKTKNLLNEIKGLLVLAALFILFNVSHLDVLIKSLIPITGANEYLLLIIKAVMFAVVWYFVKNIKTVRNL